MATYKGLARERERLANRLDRQLSIMVILAQKALLEAVLIEIGGNLLGGGSLTNNAQNIQRANQIIDSVFRTWVADYGLRIARFIGGNIWNIQDLNVKYYTTFMNTTRVQAASGDVLNATLAKYGVNIDGSINPNGYLFNAVSDQSISRRLKSVVVGGVQTEAAVSKVQANMRNLLGRVGVGLVEAKLSEAIPSGMLQVDRETNTAFATDLQLNHAIYQGGLIKTSREFCEERNNKVFTREEILRFGTSADKFGGYTNKSAGEFQGKTKVYNPLTDIGGYNCRHFYSWISEDLAFVLRPELKKSS